MTTAQITETFCKATKVLMASGMNENDAKAKAKELMYKAIEAMKN